ncbi:glutamate mutase L [Actinoplanes philippinensis]|uniref:glutamate mutase L n=1 Tax=Actinoplanes philippinensis TaxID=35752 RepID=UPI003F4CDE17
MFHRQGQHLGDPLQRPGALLDRGRPGLRDVRLVLGSGGVLRHGGGDTVLQAVLADVGGGWAPPERARALVDQQYIVAAAGLLAADHPDVATRLLGNSIR